MFTLFNILIAFLLGIIETLIGSGETLSNLYSLVILIPGIAVAVRRLHDTDRSGWWLLLPIVNIIFLALEGQSNTNRFGTDPREAV